MKVDTVSSPVFGFLFPRYGETSSGKYGGRDEDSASVLSETVATEAIDCGVAIDDQAIEFGESETSYASSLTSGGCLLVFGIRRHRE